MMRASVILALACLSVSACSGDKIPTGSEPSSPTVVASVPPFPTVDPNAPPVAPSGNHLPVLEAAVSPDPSEGTPGFRLSASMCGSFDPDGDEITYRFKFGDGMVFDSGSCAASARYQNVGKFQAYFCVSDGYVDHEVCRRQLIVIRAPR
jgi:hypothetical protein